MLVTMVMAASLYGLECAPQQSVTSAQSEVIGVVTLADALARARERSAPVQAARLRARASGDAVRDIPRMPNPVTELRGENYGPASPVALRRDVFATVAQPIELGGKRRARVTEANAIEMVSSTAVGAAEWAIAFDVAELYIEAVRAREVAATLVAQRERVREIVDLLEERVREGVGVEADLRKFETERTRLAIQITRASIALQSALIRLSAMIDRPIRAESLVTPEIPAAAFSVPPQLEASILNRTDMRGAIARTEHAEATLALQRTLGIPDLTVTAGYKRTDGFDTGIAGITMAIPLFDRNRVAVARAIGEAGAARLELEHVRQRALADVQSRWAEATQLAEQASRADADLIGPASVVRTAARAAFVEGRGDVLQLVDAERVFGEASRDAVELRLDATVAIIHARLAIGETPLP
jgi:cobalt-zinc-cadmium efflux system outer membrane protein